MTIIVATRDLIASDSRLSFEGGHRPVTVGKIFRLKRRDGIFATAGDCRRTHHIEKALSAGHEPEPLDCLEDETCDAVVVRRDRSLVLYDTDLCPQLIAEDWVVIGGPTQVAESWMLHPPGGAPDPIVAIQRAIEVDGNCGWPIQVAWPNGKFKIIDSDGSSYDGPLRKGAKCK